jgi:hypothetical protein
MEQYFIYLLTLWFLGGSDNSKFDHEIYKIQLIDLLENQTRYLSNKLSSKNH